MGGVAMADAPMRDAPHGGPRIVVRRSGLHGKGVFARRAIRRGETIIEYKGERVDEAEIARRYPENRNGLNHTFVFGLSEDLNIDGGAQGNSARFINHACEPNCDTFEHKLRVYVRAARDIVAGEELFFDYAIQAGEPLTRQLKACWPCWCGSQHCRGTVLLPSPRRRARRTP